MSNQNSCIKCTCRSCSLVNASSCGASNTSAHSSSLPTSQGSLNSGVDESQDFSSSIYVYQSGYSPFAPVRCHLCPQDLQCMGTLLDTVTAVLKLQQNVKRLISKSGKEVKYPRDLIPDEVYEARLFELEPIDTHATPKRILPAMSAQENSAIDEHEHNVSQKDYIRVFVFRPYIPIYLKKSELTSYGDVLESVSWYYGFPIHSIHHLDGKEVRSPDEIIAENVYIAVENTPTCEYFNKSGNNKDSADTFECDGMPCPYVEDVGDLKSVESSTADLKAVASSTSRCPASEDYQIKSIDREPRKPIIDRHIFVRSLYSYRGNLLPTPCGLLKNDLSSMPHLLNILSSMMHPPGHFFTRLFDKYRKEVTDPRKIHSGREYLALPHIVSHKGWNYLQREAPMMGWAWNGYTSSSSSVLSISSGASMLKSEPDENSFDSRNYISSSGTSICDLGRHSIHDLPRKPSDQFKKKPPLRDIPSSFQMVRTSSLPIQPCYSEGSSEDRNDFAVAKCSHTGHDIGAMHEIIPSAIFAAMTDSTVFLQSVHTLPDSRPIILNVSSISLRTIDSGGSEGKQLHPPSPITSSVDRLSSSLEIKSYEDDADNESCDDSSLELYANSDILESPDSSDDETTQHPVDAVLDTTSHETILKSIPGNSLSSLDSHTTTLHAVETPRGTAAIDKSSEIPWTNDEGTPPISEATAGGPSLYGDCKGPPEKCDDESRHSHSQSQVLTAPLQEDILCNIFVYLDPKSHPVRCYLTEDDLVSIKTLIDAIARHAYLKAGVITGLNTIQGEPIETTDEIQDGEYYIAMMDSDQWINDLSPVDDDLSEKKPSLDAHAMEYTPRVSFLSAENVVIPPHKSSEPSSGMPAKTQPSHIFVCLQGMEPTTEIIIKKDPEFSWPDLMYTVTSKVCPDDQVEIDCLISTDGKIATSLDDLVNGCLYVAVPKSSAGEDQNEPVVEETAAKPDMQTYQDPIVPTVEETVGKQHIPGTSQAPKDAFRDVPVAEEPVVKEQVQPSQAERSMDEVFRNLLKGIIASETPPKRHPTSDLSEATSSPDDTPKTEAQSPGKKDIAPYTNRALGSIAQMQDILSKLQTGIREPSSSSGTSSTTSSDTNVADSTVCGRDAEDDTPSDLSREEFLLAPSLINMAHLIIKLLEIVVALMQQELLRAGELE